MCKDRAVVNAASISNAAIDARKSERNEELRLCDESLAGKNWYGSWLKDYDSDDDDNYHGLCGCSKWFGEKGGNGYDGKRGHDGGHGKPAPNCKLVLEGSKHSLHINGSEELYTSGGSFEGEKVLLINCRGGRGGICAYGGSGGDGGRGGDGNINGDGGDGGNGGDGGDGGDAGDGGSCIIEAADPALFKLVEVDCRSGDPGSEGDRGYGGRGRAGGDPGGKNGLCGDKGEDGKDGQPGKEGESGENGSFMWVVTSADGNTESSSRYDAEIVSYDLTPAFDDGVFEPNAISGVTVRNTGGLALPLGSTAFMPSTADIKFEQLYHEIPGLNPGEAYVIPVNFHGRICDVPSPNEPKACKKTAKFHPRIELLGRPFEKSFNTREVSVQYPLQLVNLLCPTQIKRGEISTISIMFLMLSTAPVKVLMALSFLIYTWIQDFAH